MSIQGKIGPKDEGDRWGLRLWGPEWQGGTSRGPNHTVGAGQACPSLGPGSSLRL